MTRRFATLASVARVPYSPYAIDATISLSPAWLFGDRTVPVEATAITRRFNGIRGARRGALAMYPGGSRGPAALAQISTPSAAHFLKSHQLLVQKFAADRDRQKSRVSLAQCTRRFNGIRGARRGALAMYPGGRAALQRSPRSPHRLPLIS
jgi:hypothetical protein